MEQDHDGRNDRTTWNKIAAGRAALERTLGLLSDQSGHSDRAQLLSSIELFEKTAPSIICRDVGVYCCDLGRLLLECHMSSGDECLLMEAINLGRLSLALCQPGHPNRADSCGSLAISLRTHHKSTGDDQLLNEVILLQQEALALCPPGHSDRANSCRNLAVSYWVHCLHNENDQLLLKAINLQRESLALCPPEHPQRADACVSLANSLALCSIRTGDDQLLSEAINLQRESLSLFPRGHSDRARFSVNLSISLWKRFRSTGDDQLLTEAIDLQREALGSYHSGHPYRAASCTNLASSLRQRVLSTGDHQLLTEAIALQRESLALYPPGHPNRQAACTNLASSLRMCFENTGSHQVLAETIELERESLALCPTGHPDRAMSCSNLAYALRTRYNITGDKLIMDEIHALSEEGLSLTYPSARWRPASMLVWVHLQPNSHFFNVVLAIEYLFQAFLQHPDHIPEAVTEGVRCLDVLWNNSNCELHVEHNVALSSVYQSLVRLLPFLNNPALDARSQLRALLLCKRLGSGAFVNDVLAGAWQSGVEELEVVQGLYWSQHLHYRDPQFEQVPVKIAATLESLMREIAAQSTVASEVAETTHMAPTSRDIQHDRVTHVYALLREIRAIPGLDRFMLGEAFDELRSVASKHPVVILTGAHGHFFALILTSQYDDGKLIRLSLEEKDFGQISCLKHATRSSRGATSKESAVKSEDDRGTKMSKATPISSTNDWMRYLWWRIVEPVFDKLGLQPSKNTDRPRLHWYATGEFTALPLHAAGIYDGPVDSRACCADYVVSSYTPTLTTLLRAQTSTANILPLRTDSLNVVLVAEKQARESHLQVIDQVDAEVNIVDLVSKSRSIQRVKRLHTPVTISATCSAMQAANIVHLACHGIQDGANALESGFCLGDGRLTISKLMELKLDNPFLAFLSACETATGDQNQPDQVMHLAATMMFIGFKSVVATMWAISDIDGPKVAQWFYEELFSKDVIDDDAVAYALDIAVRKLRDSGVSLDRWAPFIHMGV